MKSCKAKDCMALLLGVIVLLMLFDSASTMSAEEKMKAKEHVVELFYHSYNAYMENAYPADELMPLSCKGRYRGSEPSRGDVDDTLGNFTLTLIDSVDTLAVLGDVEGFEEAVLNIIKDARFDCDVIVSVFETNIRILGGLLGGHVMASYFKRRGMGLSWYNDELLSRAKEVGDRLLPAFNTSTGIPYPRINLKHGIIPQITSSYRDTCTACAGSMILEFAALSRLTGLSVYEEKARKAMDYLWQQRHRTSDLMGLIINIHNGDWIRRESGVGAGIDSYYEYVLKAYILLGDDNYLDRFNKHYNAVMRYVSQGPLLMDVHMHKPNSISRNFMDALLAFWPGLQVLKGDLVPAIETHEMLYQVLQRHNFIPEAFTTDFRVHWGHHPLRPEFIESTYFLYKATGDNYYLEVGKKVLDNLQAHARVDCGLAAIKNVKTGAHEDQMDSYVLAETFKYLYLLFAEKEDMVLDIDDFIFTTEAHLLPLSLSIGNLSVSVPKIRREAYSFKVDISPPISDSYVTSPSVDDKKKEQDDDADDSEDNDEEGKEGENMCPALHTTHEAGQGYPHTVRSQVQHLVNRAKPHAKNRAPRLRASEFIAGNKEQLEQLHAMGIRIATMADGRVQLLHTASEALSPEDAEDGMQFMQEMIELSKHQQQEPQHDPMYVHVHIPGLQEKQTIRAGPAQFGYNLKKEPPVAGMLTIARPYRACKEIENKDELAGHIIILERGDCMFVDKARNLQRVGAKGGIVIDHTEGSTSESQPLFAMSGDGTNDVDIPLVFLYHAQGQQLLQLLEDNSFLEVVLSSSPDPDSKCSKEPITDTAAEAANQQGLQATGGQATDTPPLDQKPRETPTDADMTGDGEGDEDDDEDSFYDLLDDKFYHHAAQLRDLYYLQTGSRYFHINVEVRPTSSNPKPLMERENTFSLDVLPDSSKMMTVRLSYESEGYEHAKPQLNQLYVDTIQLIKHHTNFHSLPHTNDYLRALARCLEAGYFGLEQVDKDTLTLMRWLSRQLQYVHVFPAKAEKPDVPSSSSASANGQKSHAKPYAGVEDFTEPSSTLHRGQSSSVAQGQGSSESGAGQGAKANQYVRFVPPEDGKSGYAARVDTEGRLKLVQEPSVHNTGQRRNAFSIRMSADTNTDIKVKITDEDAHISQSQSFKVSDAPSPDSDFASVRAQSSISARTEGQAAASSDQSDLSGSSFSQSSSSSQPLSQSESSKDSEGGEERTAGLQGDAQGEGVDRTGREASTPLSGPVHEDVDRTRSVSSGREVKEGSRESVDARAEEHRPDDEL